MRSIKKFCITSLALVFICAMPIKNRYTLSSEYTVTIHGTSNLHNWDEKVGSVSGEGAVDLNADGAYDVNTLDIKMEVHSIKSDMGSIMNNNTYKALKADANPQIILTLSEPLKGLQMRGGEKTVSAKVNLTIAGVTRPVTMLVKIAMLEGKKLSVEGSQVITMTDYGIKPPTALLGTLKTGNEITINFKTSFTAKEN